MDTDARRAHAVTLLITLIGAACCILQAVAPFRGGYEFLTVQVTFVAGALTYARAVRWLIDSSQAVKARLILRGNVVVLASVVATLILDSIAQFVLRPRPYGVAIAMAVLDVLTLAAAFALAVVFRRIPTPPPPPGLTVADGIEDLLTLVRWAVSLDLDRLFAPFRALNPRRHPWNFAVALGFACGLAFFIAHLQEGLPPNLRTGILVLGIFAGIELVATLLGFVTLGPYLGLRGGLSASSRK
jgi:hypothetical protein